QLVDRQLTLSARQYDALAAAAADNVNLPRTVTADGKLVFASPRWWTSGFVPGSLWQLYEYDQNPVRLEMARRFTDKVENEQYNTSTHDLGFMLYCSFGNGYRLTGEARYRTVLLNGARSLISRFNPLIGCIQSWQKNEKWQFPVIIDNMMNLELLMWAFKQTGDSTFAAVCIRHADRTMAEHFRPDYSTYHVVSYDTLTGRVQVKNTAQGAFDESAWARGQAWGLYGFTMLYRETGLPRYLDQAQKIADFLITHPAMPADGIPYWDFNAPGIPNAKQDASAAAIMASALLELGSFSGRDQRERYHRFAEKQIRSLSTPRYFAEPGENGHFLLMHGVGHKPLNSEVDVPLTYADYYYIEALMRYRRMAGDRDAGS
ncbi:glucuronyl hydrolase, partial [bacterium]|nr:glucuronyl hydrolase [bacterium]